MTVHLTLLSILRAAGVKLRLQAGVAQWKSDGLTGEQRTWLANHKNDIAQGLVEEAVTAVFGPSRSVVVIPEGQTNFRAGNPKVREGQWRIQQPEAGKRRGE